MSDTPETDAKVTAHIGFYSCATVPAELCRRMERERDEARDELRDIRLNLGANAEGYTLLHAVCVIQNERDEAQYKLEDARQSLEVALGDLSEAKRERDELLERNAKLRDIADRALTLNQSQ